MEVIPAIDLRDGRCVRLYQGDFSRQEVFSEDPVGVALRWEREGAARLHVVDLDGAATGSPANLEVIGRIASRVAIPVQVGGGIRTLESAMRLWGLGVRRVAVGTAALEDPGLVSRLLEALGPDAVAVSIDARDGLVAVRGWTEQSRVAASDLVEGMAALGARRFIYTDIARDGTLTEPNFQALAGLVALEWPVIASGGVASVEHLVRLAALGAEGAIVGKALYTGAVALPEALERLGRGPAAQGWDG